MMRKQISDHQQSWGYEDGPWKGPGPPLLVVADFSAIRVFSQTSINAHTTFILIRIRTADPPKHTQRIAVIINIFRVDPLEFFRYICIIILYKNTYRLIDKFTP
jgi:hypothetical protein